MVVSQPGSGSAPESDTGFVYVPYHLLEGRPNLIVDGSATEGTVLTLSHWPKSPCPPGLEEDLSAEMAFAYLARLDLHGEATAVSNNHFDQDGLVSLFALVQPETAMPRRQMLTELARAGDFGTYSNRDAARASMVISKFADPARSPVGSGGSDYLQWTSQLYEKLLPRVTEICEQVDGYRDMWEDEDAALDSSEEAIASGRVRIEEDPQLDLAVVHVGQDAPRSGGHLFAGDWRMGLHPMAINNATERFTVLVVTGRRYELYYRYESWVQYRSARPRARVDLAPFVDELNSVETSDGSWVASKVSALIPTLKFRGEPERFRTGQRDRPRTIRRNGKGTSSNGTSCVGPLRREHAATDPRAQLRVTRRRSTRRAGRRGLLRVSTLNHRYRAREPRPTPASPQSQCHRV